MLWAAPGFADLAKRGPLGPPISIVRYEDPDPSRPPRSVINFRESADQIRWLTFEGPVDRGDFGAIGAEFEPDVALTFYVRYRGRVRLIEIPTPAAGEIGFDGNKLILFGRASNGLDLTARLDRVRVSVPGLACARLLAPFWSATVDWRDHEFDHGPSELHR
jgi:hypothetical protein